MSEWCKVHRQDYNILCGCSGCKSDAEERKSDAEPILSKALKEQLFAQEPPPEVVENLRAQLISANLQLAATQANRDQAVQILQNIKRRGYYARGEAAALEAFLTEMAEDIVS